MLQGNLIWVRMPFSDGSGEKLRPALVLSNTQYNNRNEDVIVCGITSNLQEREYSISLTNEQLAEGRLPLPSRIKADKIFQLNKSLVAKPFARVKPRVFDEVVKELTKLVKREESR